MTSADASASGLALPHEPIGPPLGRGLVLTLAAGTGITAANLYYAQPLLHTIAERFGASVGSAGLIVTASQIGYAFGLALLVPAGDLFDRRRLVPRLLLAAAALLCGAAAAPSLGVLVSQPWRWSASASWSPRSWYRSLPSLRPTANAARWSGRS